MVRTKNFNDEVRQILAAFKAHREAGLIICSLDQEREKDQ